MRFAKAGQVVIAAALAAMPLAAPAQDAPEENPPAQSPPIAQWQVETRFVDRGAGGAGNTVTRVHIAPGETFERWTRQAKEVRMKSMAILMKPQDSAVSTGESLKRACPETVIGDATQHVIGKTRAVMQRADCPLNAKSGLPLVVISAAWNEGLDVQLKSVLFAYIPSPEDVALAEEFLLAPAAPVDWDAYPAKRETSPSG